jgi:hypothetical protein
MSGTKRVVLIMIYVLFSVFHHSQFENRFTIENCSRSSKTLPSHITTWPAINNYYNIITLAVISRLSSRYSRYFIWFRSHVKHIALLYGHHARDSSGTGRTLKHGVRAWSACNTLLLQSRKGNFFCLSNFQTITINLCA